MRTVVACIALVSWGILTPIESRGDDPAAGEKHEKVLERLNGTWKIVGGANQGKKLSKEQLGESQVIIQEKSIVVLDPAEKEIYRAKYQIDISTSPFQIDMLSDTPNAPKLRAAGIFELRKEGWLLCYGLPGEERPKKFVSPEGSHVMLFNMVRVDTAQKDATEVKPIKEETIKEHQEPAKAKKTGAK